MSSTGLSSGTVLHASLECVVIDSETGAQTKASLEMLERCSALEQGKILMFPQSPIRLSDWDRTFLCGQRQLESQRHKNIAYRPMEKKLTGTAPNPDLQRILKAYSAEVTDFLTQNFACYTGFRLDYASYRPIEEQGRKLRLRARNDLIHVDSFPTRPTYGDRILRFFTNIHPEKNRVWQTSSSFEQLAPAWMSQLPDLKRIQLGNRYQNSIWPQLLKRFGLRQSHLSGYDHWMSTLHDRLKADGRFQKTCVKNTIAFPPGSSWLAFTDMVSHSVVSGQYALEQTVIIPVLQMVQPDKAPIHILQRLL